MNAEFATRLRTTIWNVTEQPQRHEPVLYRGVLLAPDTVDVYMQPEGKMPLEAVSARRFYDGQLLSTLSLGVLTETEEGFVLQGALFNTGGYALRPTGEIPDFWTVTPAFGK